MKLLLRFAFLATVPVVFIYWLAYFIILTKGESPPSKDDERSRLIGQYQSGKLLDNILL